jgi:hypothetical protein
MKKITSFVIAFFLLFGCKSRTGLSEYAKSMAFCVTIVRHIDDYKKNFHKKPSGTELKKYLNVKGFSENVTDNWIFGENGDKYIAYKVNVQTHAGSSVTIIIFDDGEYVTLGLKK